jgi:hypothetical protein
LESLIGKGKRLEGQQSRSGFTKMVLGMAAAVIKPTTEGSNSPSVGVRTLRGKELRRRGMAC